MSYKKQVEELLGRVVKKAKQEKKLTGFTIGNTTKIDHHGLYCTPLRETTIMICAGTIVYSEQQAIDIARIVDGKVDYVLVDAEKKIPHEQSPSVLANIERVVRENVRSSTLWIYKGNDLCVDAVDGLLTQLTKNSLRGLGGKKIAILGAGNIGFKLALRLLERGAYIFITRRNQQTLETLTKALNAVKPMYTRAEVVGMTDNKEAARLSDILIGTSHGTPLITSEMVESLADNAIIIDVGKGVLFPEAIQTAQKLNIKIYRLDITAAFEGLVHHLWAIESILDKKSGRKEIFGESIVSGGLLGQEGEIVVDNVNNPSVIYGIADGKGDFIRELSQEQIDRINKLQGAFKE